MPSTIPAIAKTAIFTLFIPGTVAGYIPWRLRDNNQVIPYNFEAGFAIALIATGIAIYFHTAFWGFAAIGKGTPAPIDPPKTLVVRGLHRYVRNPMYIGVLLVIAGQAWLFWSRGIAIYALCVAAVFHVWVLIYEEPALKKQFGEEYERYKASVPRWIPKLRL